MRRETERNAVSEITHDTDSSSMLYRSAVRVAEQQRFIHQKRNF